MLRTASPSPSMVPGTQQSFDDESLNESNHSILTLANQEKMKAWIIDNRDERRILIHTSKIKVLG